MCTVLATVVCSGLRNRDIWGAATTGQQLAVGTEECVRLTPSRTWKFKESEQAVSVLLTLRPHPSPPPSRFPQVDQHHVGRQQPDEWRGPSAGVCPFYACLNQAALQLQGVSGAVV